MKTRNVFLENAHAVLWLYFYIFRFLVSWDMFVFRWHGLRYPLFLRYRGIFIIKTVKIYR